MALQSCNDVRGNNYCGVKKSQIDGDCHDLDYQAGNKIVLQASDKGSRCYCVCSCLAFDTPVGTPKGTIKVQDIKVDETEVLAAGLDLNWQPTVVGQWSVASPGKTVHVIYVRYQTQDGEKEIIVTRDQLFLTVHGKLVPADKLAPRDELTDRDGQAVQILSIGWGTYDGEFYELATEMAPPDKEFTNHLILTNEVVTADFAVQMFQDAPGSHAFAHVEEVRTRHCVGAPEWIEEHGGADKAAKAPGADNPRFTHADENAVKVPEHASDFLPVGQANILRKSAPKLPIGDPTPRQEVEYLIQRFKCLYGDCEFHFNWYDHAVNANSWVDTQSGQKNIYISGGLARIEGFAYEGMCLAIAHELGHLYGKEIGDSGVTCEGEADYYGAKIVLRKFWFGERYLDGMDVAVAQFNTLVDYLRPHMSPEEHTAERGDFSAETGRSGKRYPSILCRRKTFAAAMNLSEKPSCAACK